MLRVPGVYSHPEKDVTLPCQKQCVSNNHKSLFPARLDLHEGHLTIVLENETAKGTAMEVKVATYNSGKQLT